MNPDQTAPMEQSDLGSYWLQYWLTQSTERADVDGKMATFTMTYQYSLELHSK